MRNRKSLAIRATRKQTRELFAQVDQVCAAMQTTVKDIVVGGLDGLSAEQVARLDFLLSTLTEMRRLFAEEAVRQGFKD